MTFQPGDTVTPQQAWRKPNETSARENWKGCGSRKQKLQPEYRSRSIRRNEASCELASDLHRETARAEGKGEMMMPRPQQWTEAEVHRLRMLAKRKVSADSIAKLLGRYVGSVKTKARELNLIVSRKVKGK
jgi:hypothetical protein